MSDAQRSKHGAARRPSSFARDRHRTRGTLSMASKQKQQGRSRARQTLSEPRKQKQQDLPHREITNSLAHKLLVCSLLWQAIYN